MEYNFGGFDSVALAGEELEEIQIEEVFLRQVSDVQTGELIFLLLGLVMSLTTAS